MLSNISISMDAAGNVKFDKSKSIDKIDGMVALAMAIAMEMGEEHKEEFTGKILIL
jgi:phage terminase large subunit-like protein